MGDAPYYWWEEQQYDHLIDALNRDSLDLVVHIGDVFWAPCSTAKMIERREVLQRLRHPLVFVPGDNEWTDCWGSREGQYRPLERLDTLRTVYYPEAGRSLGGAPLELAHQGSDPEWPEFVEHQRWASAGVTFATFHLVGSRNGREDFPGRSEASDTEANRRTAAATAWLGETFGVARRDSSIAVVLFMHADPGFEESPEEAYRLAYEPFIETLEREVAAYAGPVLMAHGDNHEFTVDQPLVDRRSGQVLENLTRLEVMGSPTVGWVRVVVDSDARSFSFAPRTVSGWRIW